MVGDPNDTRQQNLIEPLDFWLAQRQKWLSFNPLNLKPISVELKLIFWIEIESFKAKIKIESSGFLKFCRDDQ